MQSHTEYLTELGAAYVRGELRMDGGDEELLTEGLSRGLKMYRFKRSELPRVKKCIGLLKGLRPHNLLDVGSGRGAFLWTMLSEIPTLTATCVDILEHRVKFINTVKAGGFPRVEAQLGDVQSLDFENGAFEVSSALEVLEHLPDPGRAVRELCRVSKNWLLVSVPSKADNNPEHINLFSSKDLESLLLANGAKSVQLHSVLNHRIALAKLF